MQLFKHYLLFALILAALLALPAGLTLLDAAERLRAVREAAVLAERLRTTSDLLRALRDEQAASVRLHAANPAGRNELAAARERTDTALGLKTGEAMEVMPYRPADTNNVATLRRVGSDGTIALLLRLRRKVDEGTADAVELLSGYRAYAERVQAERLPDGESFPPALAGPVGAWLLLQRSMDYMVQERDSAWLATTGHRVTAGDAVLELCGLAAQLDAHLRRQAAWGLPPALASAVAAAGQGVSEPANRHCAAQSAAVSSRGDAVAWLDALAVAETRLVQWSAETAQEQMLTIWARGFVTMAAGAALFLLLALYGFHLLHSHARPLAGLLHAVRTLQLDPAAALRVHADGGGEVAALAAAFNDLIDTRQEDEQYQRLSDSVFEHALDGILVTDADGTIQAVNPALGVMLGYPGHTLMYRNVRLFKSGRHDAEFYRAMWQAINEQGAWRGEIWNRRSDGAQLLMQLSIAAVRDAAGAALRYIGIYSDVTEQRRAVDELQHVQAYHRTVIAALGEGLYCVDGEGVLRFLNPAGERMLGWREKELLGRNAHDIFHGKRPDGTPLPRNECMLLGVFRDGVVYHGEEMFTRSDGSRFPVECHATPLREDGELTGAVVAFTDISRRKEDERHIHYLAYHDSLTGLANRSLLLQHLGLFVAQGQRYAMPLAVLFIDLDHFKHINDSLGHHVGDALLMETAKRLQGVLRTSDLLARQGGDEFIVVCSQGRNGAEGDSVCDAATFIAAKIHAVLAEPFLLADRELYVSASIGIACLPEHGSDPDTLLRHADQAMYRAKSAGSKSAVYAPGDEQLAQDHLMLTTRLHGALVRKELYLLIQPVVDLASGRIAGGEALLRWNVDGREVGPGLFIPMAEDSGEIVTIGAWVNAEACRLAAQWRALRPDFVLAVNLSPRQFYGCGLLRDLCRAMSTHGLGHGALELEITETVTMSLPRRATRSIHWLRQRGLRLSIDDFGTGHSSLKRLQEITADRLKVDRSFVKGLPDAAHSVTIVRNTIALAHDLGMSVVAEGVETEAQRQQLLELGCDYAQGFLFSRPVDTDEFTRMLARGVLKPAAEA